MRAEEQSRFPSGDGDAERATQLPFAGWSGVSRNAILMALFFLSAILGQGSEFKTQEVPLVWPPFGISLAAILLFGFGCWPGVALGALLYGCLGREFSWWFVGGVAIGNSLGAVLCAYLLTRTFQFKPEMRRVRDVAGFVLLACMLGTTVNAAFNAASLMFSGEVDRENLFGMVVHWWVPNAMAGLIVTPALLVWGVRAPCLWSRTSWVEGLVCGAGLVGATLVSFNSWYVHGIENYPLAYLPYPFLVWASLRFGQRGATGGTLLVSVLAISALLDGRGPFIAPDPLESLTFVGCYLSVLAAMNMLLAAAAMEKEVAEVSARSNEARYRAIVEDQTEMIWRFTADGSLTFANHAYCKFHGGTLEELIGTKYLSMLADNDREIPLSYFQSLPESDPVLSYDLRLVVPGGGVAWHQCTTRRLFDGAGNTLEFQSVAQDITRRKLTEEQVREAEQKQRAILNAMVDGVLVLDSDGRITMANPAAQRLLEAGEKDLMGKEAAGFFADPAAYVDCVNREPKDGAAAIVETPLRISREGEIPVELGVSRAYFSGRQMVIAVLRDIRERRKLEQQMRQAQKMDVLGRLASGIAHDFNNVVQAILGYANMLSVRLTEQHPQIENVREIERAAERATALTSQLLAFSRKQVLKPKVISLNRTVADMARLLRRLVGEGIKLDIRPGASSDRILADPNQIEQVILNLVLNARDAMPEGGGIILETGGDYPPASGSGSQQAHFSPGSFVRLGVVDTGCGITPEVMARLFEPFFTTKQPGKGTGLGLSIVYGIVKQTGGDILVHSAPGQGTRFDILFACVSQELDVESGADVAQRPDTGHEAVLLVEQGQVVRAMLAETLKSNGYKVVEAANAEEAAALAGESGAGFDVVVTDVGLPRMNGISLVRELAAARPGLRVLLMSGQAVDEISQIPAGVRVEFIQKPFRSRAFLSKLRGLLDTPA